MGFKDDIEKLSVQLKERASFVRNEETTKQALIIPFLQVLGYDVFNPLEVQPEYTADFGKKKGEKVDYAIFKDNQPIVFIEAKPVNENLGQHSAQLARYFNATPKVRLAILTNGLQYKFYTDLNSNNIMDETPFLVINICECSQADIDIIAKFRKDVFSSEEMLVFAEELIYTSNLNAKLKELFKNPPDDFIRFLIKDFSDTRITSNVLDRFRPIVKKSISKALLDIVSQGLFQDQAAVTAESQQQEIVQETQLSSDDFGLTQDNKRVIETTEEEFESFKMITDVLNHNKKDSSQIGYKDTTAYFAVYIKNILNWFIRINISSTNKHIITRLPIEVAKELSDGRKVEAAPKGMGVSRIYIDSHKELIQLDKLIIECYDSLIGDTV